MTSSKLFVLVLALAIMAGCGGGGGGGIILLPRTLTAITITPANPSIAAATSLQFTATGRFSDNTTQDLTASVIWSSSTASVATVSNAAGFKGRATAIAAGSTSITAAMPVTSPVAGTISDSTSLTVTGDGGGNNVLAITVDGSLCSSGSYVNKLCVSVTICTPGTATCQTLTDILLDTGSVGLRIFKQALSVTLPQVTAASGSLAECIQFADNTSLWGPVQTASVILGSEPAVQVPIQVVDATFGTLPGSCRNAEASPAVAGFNGILGLGLFVQDCGNSCNSAASNPGWYYACSGSACSVTEAPLTSQVQNPVALLPVDNNGVFVQLPGIPSTGAPSVNGTLVLGIGTQSNNTPAGATMYSANQFGEFTTTFNGTTSTTSFIDSGSNGLYFSAPTSLLPPCPAPNSGFYCPATTVALSATNTGASGSPSGVVSFEIANLNSLFNTSNNVFADIGGSSVGGFDWGLPFFLGRTVFVGIEGKSSSLGTGPYWAY